MEPNSIFRKKRPRASRSGVAAEDSDNVGASAEKKPKASPAVAVATTTPLRAVATGSYASAGNVASPAFANKDGNEEAATTPSSSSAAVDTTTTIAPPPPVPRTQPSPVATSPLRRTVKPTEQVKKDQDAKLKSAPAMPPVGGSNSNATPKPSSRRRAKNPFVSVVLILLSLLGHVVMYRAWQQDQDAAAETLRLTASRVASELHRGHQHQLETVQTQLRHVQQEAKLFKTLVQQLQEKERTTAAAHEQALTAADHAHQAATRRAQQAWQEEQVSLQRKWQQEHQAACDLQVQACRQKVQTVQHDARRHQQELQDLLEECRVDASHTVQRLQQERNDAVSQAQRVQADLEQALDRLGSAQQPPDVAQEQADAAAAPAADLQAQLDDLWTRARELEQNRNDWERLARQLDEEMLPAAQRKLEAAQQEVERLAQQVEDDTVERQRLRTRVHELQQELAQSKGE